MQVFNKQTKFKEKKRLKKTKTLTNGAKQGKPCKKIGISEKNKLFFYPD